MSSTIITPTVQNETTELAKLDFETSDASDVNQRARKLISRISMLFSVIYPIMDDIVIVSTTIKALYDGTIEFNKKIDLEVYSMIEKINRRITAIYNDIAGFEGELRWLRQSRADDYEIEQIKYEIGENRHDLKVTEDAIQCVTIVANIVTGKVESNKGSKEFKRAMHLVRKLQHY